MALACVVGGGLIIGLSGPAKAWEEDVVRGMNRYSIEADGGRVQVTCDPDRVFDQSPNGSVIVEMPEGDKPDRVVFLSETGEQAAFDSRDGIATEIVSPVAWDELIEMMRTGGRLAVVTARDDFTIEAPALSDLRC